jgi:hypothetical protein
MTFRALTTLFPVRRNVERVVDYASGFVDKATTIAERERCADLPPPQQLLKRAFAAVLVGRTILHLEDGLEVRRVRVMGDFRIEVSGFTDGMVDRLKAMGLVSHRLDREPMSRSRSPVRPRPARPGDR